MTTVQPTSSFKPRNWRVTQYLTVPQHCLVQAQGSSETAQSPLLCKRASVACFIQQKQPSEVVTDSAFCCSKQTCVANYTITESIKAYFRAGSVAANSLVPQVASQTDFTLQPVAKGDDTSVICAKNCLALKMDGINSTLSPEKNVYTKSC